MQKFSCFATVAIGSSDNLQLTFLIIATFFSVILLNKSCEMLSKERPTDRTEVSGCWYKSIKNDVGCSRGGWVAMTKGRRRKIRRSERNSRAIVRKEWRGREVLPLSFVRCSPCFPTRGIHFKDRRNISIGCKGDSQRRFSAGQLAKGCTKSCPDISRVYQSQCGSGVPDTATLDAARTAHRRRGEAGEKD